MSFTTKMPFCAVPNPGKPCVSTADAVSGKLAAPDWSNALQRAGRMRPLVQDDLARRDRRRVIAESTRRTYQLALVDAGHRPHIDRAAGVVHLDEEPGLELVGAQNTPSTSTSRLPAIPGAASIRVQSLPCATMESRFAADPQPR